MKFKKQKKIDRIEAMIRQIAMEIGKRIEKLRERERERERETEKIERA